MEIVITQWGLDSYLELKAQGAFQSFEYSRRIRPDILLLKIYPNHPKFLQSKFWSFVIQNGYKMKWHNMGNGKNQIRLTVAIFGTSYLCEAYVKQNAKQEARFLARFKTHLQLIRMERFTEKGKLS